MSSPQLQACRGTGCQGLAASRQDKDLLFVDHDGGDHWSPEGGLPCQAGRCCDLLCAVPSIGKSSI